MRVLLIGGTRFLGPAIAKELFAHGHAVTVMHRGQTPACLPEGVRTRHGDARSQNDVEPLLEGNQYDAIVDTILNAEDLRWLLPLAHAHTGQLLHCGSTGVYAPAAYCPVREDDPTPCPQALGGFGFKLEQDQALLDYHEQTGFKTCSLRISNVFGVGDVPLDVWGARNPAYFQRVADGKELWIPGDGNALLQPVHVDDLARGFRAALESEKAAGQIYNLSSERAVTLNHYVEITKELLGSDSPIKQVSMEDILAHGKANESGLRFICEHMSIDWTKARQELGYRPKITLQEGLADSLGWMISQGMLASV
jgi:nucleoside-diphosphate-sugar epimerase